MRSVYFATFLLGESEEDTPESISVVAQDIDVWLFSNRSFERPKDLSLLKNAHFTIDETFEITTRYIAKTGNGGDQNLLAVRFEHPDTENRERNWQTEIVLSHNSNGRNTLRVSVDVSIGRIGRRFALLKLSPTRPRLVPNLITKYGAREIYPLKAQHITIKDGETSELLKLIESEQRQLPVVFVSCDNESESPIIDPSQLANMLAGLAYVCVCETSVVSWELKEIIGNQLNAYDGAVRLYWPGFNRSDPPITHRLWTASRIAEIESNFGEFFSHILILIANVSTTRQVNDIARWEDVERELSRQYRSELRDKGDTEALLSVADEMIADLEGTIRLTYHRQASAKKIDFNSSQWEERLPSLQALGVTSEMLEVAEEIAGQSDVVGVERHTLELLIRVVVYLTRHESAIQIS